MPSQRYAPLMSSQIRVASPCSADWNKMQGDDRKRFCTACQLNVYNLSDMAPGEVEQLLRDAAGQRLCGRLYARPDGTMLTQDCPIGFRARVQRVSRWAGAAFTAMMSVGFAIAQNDKSSTLPAHSQSSTGGITGVVTDEINAVIPEAKVSAAPTAGGPAIEAVSDARGIYQLTDLAPGSYVITIKSVGFAFFRQDNVIVQPHKMKTVNALLRLPLMGEVVEVPKRNRLSRLLHKLEL
jgi:hypothetical protein